MSDRKEGKYEIVKSAIEPNLSYLKVFCCISCGNNHLFGFDAGIRINSYQCNNKEVCIFYS